MSLRSVRKALTCPSLARPICWSHSHRLSAPLSQGGDLSSHVDPLPFAALPETNVGSAQRETPPHLGFACRYSNRFAVKRGRYEFFGAQCHRSRRNSARRGRQAVRFRCPCWSLERQAERPIRPNISDAIKKGCLVEGHPIYFRKQKIYFNTSLTLSAAS